MSERGPNRNSSRRPSTTYPCATHGDEALCVPSIARGLVGKRELRRFYARLCFLFDSEREHTALGFRLGISVGRVRSPHRRSDFVATLALFLVWPKVTPRSPSATTDMLVPTRGEKVDELGLRRPEASWGCGESGCGVGVPLQCSL